MRVFLVIVLFSVVLTGLSACGKRPRSLETPTNVPLAAPRGYPAAEPIPQ